MEGPVADDAEVFRGRFIDLSKEFGEVIIDTDKSESAHQILDGLNEFEYWHSFFGENELESGSMLVYQIVTYIDPSDNALAGKGCLLLSRLLLKTNLGIPLCVYKSAVQWCINVLEKSICTTETLCALEALLRVCNDANYDPDALQALVNIVTMKSKPNHSKCLGLVHALAVRCIESISLHEPVLPPEAVDQCLHVFQQELKNGWIHEPNPGIHCVQGLISSLQGITHLSKRLSPTVINELMSCVGTYPLFGLPGVSGLTTLQPNSNPGEVPEECTETNMDPSVPKVSHKIQRKKPSNGPPSGVGPLAPHMPSSSSESEFSDSESSSRLTKRDGRRKEMDSTIRRCALQAFQALVKASTSDVVFSYLPAVISTSSPSVVTCILKDPSHVCRSDALMLLANFIQGSKVYLSHAQDSERSSPFTPFGSVAADILRELHRSISYILYLEKKFEPLIQGLKALQALIVASPYHRLTRGLLKKAVWGFELSLKHKDPTIQIAAVSAMTSVTESAATPSEIRNELTQINAVQICVDFIVHNGNTGLRNEAVVALGAIARFHLPLLYPHIKTITAILCNKSILSQESPIALPLLQFIEILGTSMDSRLTSTEQGEDDCDWLDSALQLWAALLQEPISVFVGPGASTQLKVAACDCLSAIGETTLENLTRSQFHLAVALVLGVASSDEIQIHEDVRVAAVRALGIWSPYPKLHHDIDFLVSTTDFILDAVNTTKASRVETHAKAVWALASLSKALLLVREDKRHKDDIPPETRMKLIKTAMEASKHKSDKVRHSGVRALGQMVGSLEEGEANSNTGLIGDSLGLLVAAASKGRATFKTRWNACYGLGCILHKKWISTQSFPILTSVLSTLGFILHSNRSLKVRLQSAIALGAPTSRAMYGNAFTPVWGCLAKSLSTMHMVTGGGPIEKAHSDRLEQTICLTFCHLAVLVKDKDIMPIIEEVQHNAGNEVIPLAMERMVWNLTSEKAESRLIAIDYLNMLKVKGALELAALFKEIPLDQAAWGSSLS